MVRLCMERAVTGLSVPAQGDVGTFTVATLPDVTTNDRRTAWATDLHGVGGRVVSEGGYWKPIRPLALNVVANGNSNMNLMPLISAPTQLIQGALSANRNVTILTTYAYPGQRFRIKREATGLFSLLVNGLGLGLNSWADFEFDPASSAFVQTASGGLL